MWFVCACLCAHVCGKPEDTLGISQALVDFLWRWGFCLVCSLLINKADWAVSWPLPSLGLRLICCWPSPYVVSANLAHVHVLKGKHFTNENLHLPTQAWDFVFHLTRDCCGALACLELVIWIRLASNTYQSFCLCLPGASIKGIHHHTQPSPVIFHSLLLFLNLKKLCLFCDDQNFKNSPKYY